MEKIIKKRIFVCWMGLLFMLVYMIVMGEMGLGDSREISKFADTVSKMIFFGMVIFIAIKLMRYKNIIRNKSYLLPEFQLHWEKKKKIDYVKNIGFIVLLFITCTTALSNEIAFKISFIALLIVILLRITNHIVIMKMQK